MAGGALAGIGLAAGPLLAALPPHGETALDALLDCDQLPRFHPIALTGNFSSYDRSGGNDDGFSGKYSYLRKEAGGLVVAELTGAGAITHIHTPTPPDAPIAFYIDGEASPRLELPFKEMFTGRTAPFTGALVGHGLGGFFSYVPIAFTRSIKVVVRAERLQFWDINYVLFGPGAHAPAYRAGDRFALTPPQVEGRRTLAEHRLLKGVPVTLYETNAPGRIEQLRLGPPEAFASKARDIVLRMTWDNASRPAVEVPAGDFFGYSYGEPAGRSLLFGTEDGWNYARFPMPFATAARIELVSERAEPITVRSEVVASGRARAPEEGWFHAAWHRENPTTAGRPFTFVDVAGRGQLVGITLQCQGAEPGSTEFFEGDEQAVIDGTVRIQGTGSEDGFNGGWYAVPGQWAERRSLPLSGCLDYQRHLSRTGAYRLLIGDAYRFRERLTYTIEHGPERNNKVGDYTGVSFLYLDRPDGAVPALAPLGSRRVADPQQFLLSFSPTPPVVEALFAASLILGNREVGGRGVDYGRFERNAGPNPPVSFDADIGPPVLVLRFLVPAAGRYALTVSGIGGPDRAMLQLRENSAQVGVALDFYQPVPVIMADRPLAVTWFEEGENRLTLALPGRNPRSSGQGADILEIRARRL